MTFKDKEINILSSKSAENPTLGGEFTLSDGEAALKKLADKRKAIWEKTGSIYYDKQICKENANVILDTPHICRAVINKPYLLIECCFSLVDKSKRDAPFFLNRVQSDFIEKLNTYGTERPYFILKGRQQGFTTLITAIQLAYAIVRRNFSGFTVADRDDNVKTIFLDKAKMMYSRLPKRLKPTERFNSANELYFDKLNSSIRVACASENVGRSRTLSFIHYSEASFFKCSLASLQRSIQESLIPDAICVYETTAKGFGEVKELWDSGACINLFYGWWLSDEYESSTPPDKRADGWLKSRLEYLKRMGLTRNYKNYVSLYMNNIAGGTADFSDASIACMKDYYGSLRAITKPEEYFSGSSGSGYSFSQLPLLTPLYIPTSIATSGDRLYNRFLCFGTGTADESVEDYKLGNAVFTFSIVNGGSISYNTSILDDGSIKTTVSGVFQSSEDVTINEIGIVAFRSLTPSKSYGSSYRSTYPFLMWRKKLDTSINFVAKTPVRVSFDIILPNLVPSY